MVLGSVIIFLFRAPQKSGTALVAYFTLRLLFLYTMHNIFVLVFYLLLFNYPSGEEVTEGRKS
jgi:hypothetical protein